MVQLATNHQQDEKETISDAEIAINKENPCKFIIKENKIEDFDADLVATTRNLLMQDYDKSCAGGQEIYSRRHYEEIMASDATCWRYLIQRDMRPKDTVELMKQALAWRQTYKIDQISAKDLAKEFWLKAPIGFVGKTKTGHDIMYVMGKNYRKASSKDVRWIIKKMVIYLLIDWDRKRLNSMEKMATVFDGLGSTFSNVDLEFTAWLISVIEYFPARFQAFHVTGVPFLLRPIIRLMISWLPERFKQLCNCCTREELIPNVVDENNVPIEVGGSAPDTWRLAPIEAPWVKDNALYTEEQLRVLDASICHNTTEERIEQLIKMQKDFEASLNSESKHDENNRI